MDAVVWLTYDEIAERLGIERESARQQVKRKRWARQNGNDGKVKIAVPEEVLSDKSEAGTVAGTDPAQGPGHVPAQVPEPEPGVSVVLTRHIERLETQLDEALKRASDRDQIAAQRDLITAQVETLNGILEIERKRIGEIAQRADEARQRADDLRIERDRWAAAAESAQTKIDQLMTKAAEVERLAEAANARRGWWPWRRRA